MRKGERVLLFLPNCVEFVIGYYGVLKVGGVVVTSNPLLRQEELKYQLQDTQAKVVLTTETLLPLVKEAGLHLGLKAVVVADSKEASISLPNILSTSSPSSPCRNVEPDDPAMIVYTGGTTGPSKGVVLSHRNLVANAIQNATWFAWSPEDTILGVLSLYHSWGATTAMNSPIYSGSRVVLLRRFSPEGVLEAIDRERATVFYGAASMFGVLVNTPSINQTDTTFQA